MPCLRQIGLKQLLHRQVSRGRRAWFYATGVALLVQSLFPSGYMPADAQSGWLAMLCPDGLPGAFVAQLQGAHAHHHAGHDAGPVEHGGTGSCELGSSLDQPVDLNAPEDDKAASLPAPAGSSLEAVLLADRRLREVRSRAPPIS